MIGGTWLSPVWSDAFTFNHSEDDQYWSEHGALPIQLTDHDAIAYIAESDPDSLATGDPRFIGHIEGRLPPRLIEEGPGWPTIAAAIEWAGDRARIVLVRVGVPGTYYSAGLEDLPVDSPPRWPGSSVP